jgi:predicted hydrolase (HD superfamily)
VSGLVPEQVKVVPPKPQEKKKWAPPASQENEEKHQWMTIGILHDKMKDLTQVTHALQHRIDQEHIYHKDLEYELTILRHYIVNKDKYKN